VLLQACLGLEIDGARKEIRIDKPLLPIGNGTCDLHPSYTPTRSRTTGATRVLRHHFPFH
jgi:hypothetical protein